MSKEGVSATESGPIRLAIAGIHLESVSYQPEFSSHADIERAAQRGDAIIEQRRGTNDVMGGFIEVCEQAGVDMLPIVNAVLGALGPATDEAVERYAEEIAAAIAAQADWLDGVLLFLHGASWAPSYPDAECHIIDKVRAALGPDKPLMVAFDYHGNLDGRTIAGATAAFAYHKSPHTDMAQTGRRAAQCMLKTLRGEIAPVWAIAKPGVLVPSIFSATALRPLADIIERARAIEARSDCYLDISILAGFSYADAHNTGFSVLCVADGDPRRALVIADELAADIWAQRHALYRPLEVFAVSDAVDRVLQGVRKPGKPYVLLEHADRMNDSTYVLAELLRRGVQRAAVPFLWDAAAARKAAEAGAGRTVELSLGAHSSDRAGPELQVSARVLWAGTKTYRVSGTYQHGVPVNLGLTALLDVNGISISVVSEFAFAVDGDPFYIFGLRPEDFDIIVLRSKTHFRHFYEPLAQEIVIVDTPDHGPADLTVLPYRHLDTRRAFPFVDALPESTA
jgi:microcystin degradation protein MlrC